MGSIRSAVMFGGRTIPNMIVPAFNAGLFYDPVTGEEQGFYDLNFIDTPLIDPADMIINNGRITHRLINNKYRHEIFPLDRNNVKSNIVFENVASIPDVIRTRFTHSENLSITEQILTQEMLDEGHIYGSYEAEGSLVLNFNDGKRNNEFMTGKAGTVFSSYFVDEAGARSPLLKMYLSPSIDNPKMLSIVTYENGVREWLDDPARFGKITLDPILGYDQKGVLLFSGSLLVLYWMLDQATVTGPVIEMHCYMNSDDEIVKMGIAGPVTGPDYNPDGKDVYAEGVGNSTSTGLTTLVVTSYLDLQGGEFYRGAICKDKNKSTIWGDIMVPSQPWPRNSYAQNFPIEIQKPVPVTNKPTPSNTNLSFFFRNRKNAFVHPHLFNRAVGL